MGYYELYKMGTLFLGDDPQTCSVPYWGRDDRDGSDISIRDTWSREPGKTLTWVRPLGLNYLMCKFPCLHNVSWDDLNRAGFVEGKVIKLNGWQYRCRMPGGYDIDNPFYLGEWNDCVRFAGGSNKLWEWKGNASWSADKPYSESPYAIISPKHTALPTKVNSEFTYIRRIDVGFRPLLEPLQALEFTSGSLVTLDGIVFGVRQEDMAERKEGCVNFAPILYPIKEFQNNKTLVDSHVFDGVRHMRAYTLLLDGKPVSQVVKNVPNYNPGATLELTDRFYGEKYLIPWRIVCGCARPTRTVLANVPLDALRAQYLL